MTSGLKRALAYVFFGAGIFGLLGPLDAKGLAGRENDRVLQFLTDPANPDQGWVLTELNLQFNPDLKSEGKWQLKFDRAIFQKVTGMSPKSGYRHRKVQLSKTKPGNVFLLVENGEAPQKALYIFNSSDFGSNWKYSQMGKPKPSRQLSSSSSPAKAGEEVDLAAMDASTTAASESGKEPANPHGSGSPHGGAFSSSMTPVFKVLFDLLLYIRPGITPWTFDNFHTLLLLDFIPRPDIMFSFEVNPTPRYYELDYQATSKFTIRAGRIWIPFDEMNPHNSFGGYMNTSRLMQPNGVAFLPDIWADLGVGLKYQLIDSRFLNLVGQLYVVNGFQSGGVDPLAQATEYPNFASLPAPDNNTDKAVGGRLHAEFNNLFGVGFSFYTGRYTGEQSPNRRITMLGVDSQLRLQTGTSFKFGYVFMSIGLPPPASPDSFNRGGLYAEARQKFGAHWYASVRGGITQGDSRVTDVNDQTIIGERIGYLTDMFDLSLQHHNDLQDITGKVNREFTAFRFVVML